MCENGPGERSTERLSGDEWLSGGDGIGQRMGSQRRGGVQWLGQVKDWSGWRKDQGHSRRRGNLTGGGVRRGIR